ncbi:MAG TPA: GGDEF domain-containing protein [Candidatus Xenobia bacterium]|nr:GGDEF domain-containing protein [Candidatus Xenobia bacterium]
MVTPDRLPELQRRLRRLERRDWWLWMTAGVVTLLLTAGIFFGSLPLVSWGENELPINLNQALHGLAALVLLFNLYAVYQQILIKRLRRQLAEQMVLTAQLQARAEEYQQQAMSDALTGLYNRRFADQHLPSEISRAQRSGQPLTVLLFDLCGFKQINDEYGHAAGDLALKEFARHLKRTFRVSDLAMRLGGDEFLLLLPDCTAQEAQSLLNRLRPIEISFRDATIPVTFAVGLAQYELGDGPEQLLERADQVLYAQKREDRSATVPPELLWPARAPSTKPTT